MSDRINFQFVTAFIFSNRNVPIGSIFIGNCTLIFDYNVKRNKTLYLIGKIMRFMILEFFQNL